MTVKIMVTGGGGYVGNILVRELLAHGHSVVAMDPMFFGDHSLAELAHPRRFSLVRKDIRDIVEDDFEGIDAVCDLAALSNDPSAEIAPDLTEEINYKGRVNVSKTAKKAGVRRYVLASSCSIYGAGETAELTEESPTDPISLYARAALKTEEEVFLLADDRYCVSALRLATVFGLSRRMRFDLVVNIMTLHAMRQGLITVMGGSQWRPLVHVSDVARAFRRTLEAPTQTVASQVFNIGLRNYQVLGIAELVRETLSLNMEIMVATGDNDQRDYNVSFAKARDLLCFEARTEVPDGVREIHEALGRCLIDDGPETSTVGWYRQILDGGGTGLRRLPHPD